MRALLCLLLLAGPALADFGRDVKPLLAKHCVSCHGPKLARSSLRLDTATAVRAGGENGAVVVPGKSGESLLVKMIEGAKGVKPMPPKGPRLSADEVAVLRRWIDGGAKIPADEKIVARPGASHWSFQPVRRPPLPSVRDPAWTRTAVDRFILARLEKEGLRPSPEADRVTLLRRASLDLIGLPPTIAEVDAFLADVRPDAYERQVERLLSSPHYGERWGRHWLDQARYADSNGYSIDSPRSIWKYRDWVIGALNADLPFDRFTVEQLAGDLLPGATTDHKVHRLPPQHADQRGGRHRPRAVPRRGHRRSHQHDRQRLARPDRRLCPMPRPQIRPHRAKGILPTLRLLQQQRRPASRHRNGRCSYPQT